MTLLIYSLILIGYSVGLFLLFPIAGEANWKGLIPGYNLYIALKISKKPWWWLLLFIFPGVNILMLMVVSYQVAMVFNRRSTTDVLLAIFVPFIAFILWAKSKDTRFVGPVDYTKTKKTPTKEWADAIVFAVVAASIIRTYFLEAFVIPTSSMEKSLLIGDYLFVSKLNYGAKIPQTPLAIPFAHHSIPGTTAKSYLEWISLPYYRLPGIESIKRNDVVVFNYPDGDTVVVDEQNKGYGQILREYAFFKPKIVDIANGNPLKSEEQYRAIGRKLLHQTRDVIVRPVDKRENYIKRCVGIAGDTLEVRAGALYINGEMAFLPPHMQYNYKVETTTKANPKILKERFGVSYADSENMLNANNSGSINIPLTLDAHKDITSNFPILKSANIDLNKPDEIRFGIDFQLKMIAPQMADQIEQRLLEIGQPDPTFTIFPNDPQYNWTEDYFGPFVIPAAGATVELTTKNLPLYKRIITAYEGNQLAVKDGTIFINNEPATSYTFKMNYYFMMGDNRHNSADSRFWGVVPEDHIVGKPLFIWLSLDEDLGWTEGKIRWDRIFTGIH